MKKLQSFYRRQNRPLWGRRISVRFPLFLLVLLVALVACGRERAEYDVRIIIGATPTPHADVLRYIHADLLAEGIYLDISEINDFGLVNRMLSDGSIQANYFQHRPFLDAYIHATNNSLHVVGEIHVEPMGVYSASLSSLNDVPPGARVVLPVDPTNYARGLLLLQQAGLITVDPAAGILATDTDITDNPLGLTFHPVAAATVPRVMNEFDLAVINSNHLLASGLGMTPANDSLIMEEISGNIYANLLVVREEDADNPAIEALFNHLTSERVREYFERRWPGSVFPVF